MIDWWHVGANAIWILGAALLLATFSTRRYEAAIVKARATSDARFNQSRWLYGIGLLLVSLGLCLASVARLDRILWGILALISLLVTSGMVWEGRRGSRSGLPTTEDQ